MITGHVSALHILVSVPFRREGQPDISIEMALSNRIEEAHTERIAHVAEFAQQRQVPLKYCPQSP